MSAQTTVLIVDDEPRSLEAIKRVLADEFEVICASNAAQAEAVLSGEMVQIILCDQRMPGEGGVDFLKRARELWPDTIRIIISGYSDSEDVIAGVNLAGIFQYITKPWHPENLLEIIREASRLSRLQHEATDIPVEIKPGGERLTRVVSDRRKQESALYEFNRIIHAPGSKVEEAIALGRRAARYDISVLITGASGTGKELLARAIHYSSARRGKGFVVENCGALPDELLESELFGCKKGAFTGAYQDRIGLFELADGGTIFLDEIGETSAAFQVKLLRVLQEGEIRTGGGEDIAFEGVSESVWVDVIRRMDEVYSELLRNESDLERKNAELEEAEAFISSVIASVSDVLIVVNERGVIRKVNAAFTRLVGRPETDVIGARVSDFVTASDQGRLQQLFASGREGKVQEADLNFLTADGAIECLAVRSSAQFTGDRRRVGAVLSGRPISELRLAYQALHEAHVDLQQAQNRLIEQEKMASLGRLVAGVAHELNNPISFIYANIYALDRYQKGLLAYLDAVHAEPAPPERQALRKSLKIDAIVADYKPLLEGTIEGANRVTDIVKNLRRLSFSRTNERSALDIEKILRTAASLTARSKSSRAEFVFACAPGLLIEAHEGQLHQVFVNLIDNALHAVRDVADGRILISTRQDGESVEIVVADNGPGIPMKDINKIFEPFFTTKNVGEGTGLGLWISFSIVKEYGGALTASNATEGGARFTVRLRKFASGH